MPYKVVLKVGLSQIALPNGGIYDGGDEVTLSDEQFAVIPSANLVAFFSSVTPTGGGGVESVNAQTGVVILDAEDVDAAPEGHTHTAAAVGAAAATHTHAAGDVTSGTFAAARIPSLPASQIGSGTLAVARIPSLPASQVGSGTFAADRLPKAAAVADLAADADAAAIVTGVNTLLASLRTAGYLTP
jgi:hypothetical protein